MEDSRTDLTPIFVSSSWFGSDWNRKKKQAAAAHWQSISNVSKDDVVDGRWKIDTKLMLISLSSIV